MVDFFDEAFYLRRNEDVRLALGSGSSNFVSARDHFLRDGMKEGRDPNAYFNSDYYLAQNPDVAASVGVGKVSNPPTHIFLNLACLSHEKFLHCSMQISMSNIKIIKMSISMFFKAIYRHSNIFLRLASLKTRTASEYFTPSKYLNANQDLRAANAAYGLSTHQHFTQYGIPEKRDLGNGIFLADFLADPIYGAAVFAGDASGAMGRISEIIPYCPPIKDQMDFSIKADQNLVSDVVTSAGVLLAFPAEADGSPTDTTASYSGLTYNMLEIFLSLAATLRMRTWKFFYRLI